MLKPPQSTTSKPIGAYNLFELMNLMQMPDEQKDQYLLDANTLIWQGFLLEKLPGMITRDQYADLQNQLNAGKTFDDVMDWLLQLAPNFTYLLAEFASESKEKLIQRHFSSEIEHMTKLLSEELAVEHKHKLEVQLSTYKTALRLSLQQKWADIIELWNDASKQSAS